MEDGWDDDCKSVSNAALFRRWSFGMCWVKASLVRTGMNSRKTTAKGVRKLKISLMEEGYIVSSACVLVPLLAPEHTKKTTVIIWTCAYLCACVRL